MILFFVESSEIGNTFQVFGRSVEEVKPTADVKASSIQVSENGLNKNKVIIAIIFFLPYLKDGERQTDMKTLSFEIYFSPAGNTDFNIAVCLYVMTYSGM